MNECPKCQTSAPQVKAGTTAAGSQRYRCTACRYKDTPVRKGRGYPPELRRKAVQEYVDGRNLRQIARQVGLVHQTVANWVAAHADALPEHPPHPQSVETAELDELYTYVGAKKTRTAKTAGG
jgi:transposase-like protein